MPQEPDARYMTANLCPPATGRLFAIPGLHSAWRRLRIVEQTVTHGKARP